MFNKIIFALTLLLTLSSCKKEQPKKITKQTIVEKPKSDFYVDFPQLTKKEIKKYKKEINHFYESKINLDDFSGGFLVAKNGEILYEDYEGFSNYKTKEKITKNSPLHLASISKVLTASVVLRLVDENKLSLDDTFQKYFTEFPFEKITIRTLLNHRSGLPNYAYFTDDKKLAF